MSEGFYSSSTSVWSFGCNDEGALGRQTSSLDGTETTPGTVELPEPVAQLTAGDSHSAALTVSGKVFLWGNFRDSRGQMGLVTEGKAEQEPKLVVSNIVQIASGSDHVVMLTVKGDVLTMGCGEQGQLGRVPVRTSLRTACTPSLGLLKPTSLHTEAQRGA
ncbi:regulator of chromosome condensation-like [Dermacentor albipictus]|uniref:regulator of chromosome condensation-like n=1 Tax=Dermacentor albipictus TaxID=60249 RepID=UPI0038FCF498